MLSQKICSFPVKSNLEGTEISKTMLPSLFILCNFLDKLWDIDAVSNLH